MTVKPIVPKKILVAKLCCIGDVVFITPMLRALRNAYPQVKIYYLAVPWVKDIVEQIPYVDDVIIYEAPLSKKGNLFKVKETLQLISRLRGLSIDTMLIGHRNKTFGLLGQLSGIKNRIGFADEKQGFLTHPIHFNPKQYESERYFELLKPLSLFPDDLQTKLLPLESERGSVQTILKKLDVSENEKIIGLFTAGGENPGTIMPIKRLAPDKFAELAIKLNLSYQCKVLLLGGPMDNHLNELIFGMVNPPNKNIINVSSEFSLRKLPALMERCNLVIGGDTGPMHIAAAVGTPTVFLFGPSDPRLVAPIHANSRYVWKHVECSPCYTPETVMQKKYFVGNNFVCLKGTIECMGTISIDDVLQSVNHVMN